MKLSLLTAVVYSVASVQATCWCYDIIHSNKRPYKPSTPANDAATRQACEHWKFKPHSSPLVCDANKGPKAINAGQWGATCVNFGAKAGTCN
ncbi:hypothetical protein LZ31DRAFT_557682 [Colletotrichum somersetense]|nr:hypothetical protein LZ31DRAFT_557682 [Colletotrichum somersetense]